jgi:DNA-directed RNA polymerase specialized sigma24 family protein
MTATTTRRRRRRRTTAPTTPVPDAEKRVALNRATWASAQMRDAATSRDAAMAMAKESGASLREIGDACGLHPTTVASILRRDAQAPVGAQK